MRRVKGVGDGLIGQKGMEMNLRLVRFEVGMEYEGMAGIEIKGPDDIVFCGGEVVLEGGNTVKEKLGCGGAGGGCNKRVNGLGRGEVWQIELSGGLNGEGCGVPGMGIRNGLEKWGAWKGSVF